METYVMGRGGSDKRCLLFFPSSPFFVSLIITDSPKKNDARAKVNPVVKILKIDSRWRASRPTDCDKKSLGE